MLGSGGGGVARWGLTRGLRGRGAGPVQESGCLGRAVRCCVFSLFVLLLLLFPLFAVLLNCPYPDPPVSACFFFILLRTPAEGGAAMWCFCCRRQPKPRHIVFTKLNSSVSHYFNLFFPFHINWFAANSTNSDLSANNTIKNKIPVRIIFQ